MNKKTYVSINRILQNNSYRLIAIAMVFALFISILPINKVEAAGTITGTVYIDYNMNGARDTSGTAPNYAIDAGTSGVTVTAFAPNGASINTTTAADGTYSLNTNSLPAGPYRVEFTNLPSGFSPSAAEANNASAVKFVNGGTANVDQGIVNQDIYCQNDPKLVTNCYVDGDTTTADDVLISFPYSAGAVLGSSTSMTPFRNPTTHEIVLRQTQIGPTFGLGYARKTNRLYAAAYFKKHTVFGPGGPGAVYRINPDNNTVVNTFTVPGATTNSHGTSSALCAGTQTVSECDNGNIGWDAVGKTSLGGLDLSDDETKLYVMNLQNRTMYEMDAANGTVLRWQSVPGVPNVAGSVNNLSASANLPPGSVGTTNVRPFAVRYYKGKIYVGIVTSAETTPGTLSNLRAHVYEVDPATFLFTLRVSATLNHPRGELIRDFGNNVIPAAWNAWRTTFASAGTVNSGRSNGSREFGYPQPMLAGIEFDNSGNLVIGLRDRLGDQSGFDTNSNPAVTTLYAGDAAGDTLKACGTQATGWTLESGGRCGGQGTAPTNNGQGIGGGEFYFGDRFVTADLATQLSHDETSLGGYAQIPGSPQLVATVYDPVNLDAGAFSAGARWWTNDTGAVTKAYNIFTSDGLGGTPTTDTFGKASGLGELEALCKPAPLQVGNRVWNDANGNGVQDPGELPIQNVAVQLWADTTGDGTPDTQVGTTTTDAQGNYIFGGPLQTNLISNPSCSTVSVSTRVSASSDDGDQIGGNINLTRGFLPLGVSNANLQANGVRFSSVNIPKGANITNAYIQFTARGNTAGNTVGSPVITIQGDNADNTPTYTTATNNITGRADVGSVNWTIPTWNANESGAAQRTPDIKSIVQQIVNRNGWNSGNAMAFTLLTNDANRRDAVDFDSSAANAPQLVIEYANCEVKPNTAYEVRIPSSNFNGGQALNGLAPTTPDNGGVGNGDARDSDGIVLSGNQVFAPFTTGDYGNNNHSYDFGFKPAVNSYSVGNRIWYDTNNDGIIDNNEPGIPNTSVSIFLDANGDGTPDTPGSPIDTLTTDEKGYYRFDGLSANRYVIRVNPSNFTGGVLNGYQNTSNANTPTDDGIESMGAGANAENGVDPANAGDVATNGIFSNSFELGTTAEVLAENDTAVDGSFIGQGSLDDQADLTVDFGFYALSLSGTLWQDTGVGQIGQIPDNGQLDSNETRISNIRVRLYDSAGNEVPVGLDGILGTADDALSGVFTDGNGDYSFEGLKPGDYRVVVDGNNGVSSTPTEADPNANGDDNDNGFPDNTGNFPNKVVSGIVTLAPGNSGAAGNNNITNATAETEDPTVDFGFLLAPTLVKMDKLGAYFDGSNVVIEWSTGDESGNLGFNVYRESNGQRQLLTDSLIAGSALKTNATLEVKANSYRWIDKTTKYGGVYYIEDIDVDGIRTMHGPIQPGMKFGFESYDYNETSSKLLTDLVETSDRSNEKEFIGEVRSEATDVEELFEENSTLESDKQREIAATAGVKLFVREAGFYKVGFDQLARNGFDINSNRDLWQIFVGGREVPVQIGKDSIGFYGEGVDTNITDERAYFLIEGKQAGRRFGNSKGGQTDEKVSAYKYEATVQRKDRSLYLSALLNGEKENWFGALVFPNTATTQELNVSDPYDDGTDQAIVKVKLQGLTDVQHLVNVRFNEMDLGVVEYYGKGNREFEFEVPMAALYSDVNVVTLQSAGASNDISLVDTISLRYTKGYKASNGHIRFSLPAYRTAQIEGFDQTGIEVFEINANGDAIGKVDITEEQVAGTYGFRITGTSYDREFLAVNTEEFSSSIARIEKNEASTLSDEANKADFVIITPDMLNKEASELARRRQNQGWSTVVVRVEDIYDEYSYGMRSTNAIKAFLEDASSNWKLKPGYVLLFGDSSVDHRNYLDQEDRDLIPTRIFDTQFAETLSDGWLADFDGDGIEDLSIGRLPAGNTAEARLMLAKLKRFDEQKTRVKNTNLLVADDLFESYNDSLEAQLPSNAGARRINRSQVSDPQMKQEIITNMALNPMVVTYTGHGSTGVWASANVLSDADVANFANDKLAFFMLMTCLNGYTHSPYSDSLAEVLLKAENGAIASWASSGSTYASGQIQMSRQATANLFNLSNNPLPIGDLTRAAKQTTTDEDARRTWQLIGDPTIVIK